MRRTPRTGFVPAGRSRCKAQAVAPMPTTQRAIVARAQSRIVRRIERISGDPAGIARDAEQVADAADGGDGVPATIELLPQIAKMGVQSPVERCRPALEQRDRQLAPGDDPASGTDEILKDVVFDRRQGDRGAVDLDLASL